MPLSLISDCDPRFKSDFWTVLFKSLRTHLNLSTAYHPQTDGQTKNANRHIGAYLRHYIDPYQEDWDQHLTCAEFALNNHRSSSTGFTPFYMVFGQHPHTPLSLTNEVATVHSDNTPLSAEDFIKNWHMDLATARASMKTAQERQQRYANQHRRDVSYVPGQLVYISTTDIKIRTLAAKFKQRWIGPWPVTHRTGAVTYRIRLPPELRRLHPVFHVSKLNIHLTSDLNPAIVAPDVTLDLEGVAEYPIKEILETRVWVRAKIPQNRLRWNLPYGPESDSWEPAANLEECEAVDAFLAKQDSLGNEEPTLNRRRSPRLLTSIP
jgi:hypothetical protein